MDANKLFSIVAVIIATVAVIISAVPQGVSIDQFGNATASFWDTVQGYKVSGTEVISSSRGISATTETLSSTLAVSGETQLQGLVAGGAVYTTTTATSTLGASDVCDYGTWIITPSASALGGLTLTLPTTTTLAADCLDSVGDMKSIFVVNNGSNASTTYFASNLGIDFIKSGDTGGVAYIDYKESGLLTFRRITTATTSVELKVFDVAD